MVEPWGGVGGGGSLGAERANEHLGDDGADLAGSGGETVRGGTVAGGEAFSGGDESRGVRAEVEEELGEDVESEETLAAEIVVGEANDDEKDGEHDEAHELDGPSADGINGGNGDPVARDCARADKDDVPDSYVVEKFVNVLAAGVPNSSQNDRVVQSKTVEGNLMGVSIDSRSSEVAGMATYIKEKP